MMNTKKTQVTQEQHVNYLKQIVVTVALLTFSNVYFLELSYFCI